MTTTRTFDVELSVELNPSTNGTVYLYVECDVHEDLRSLSLQFPDFLRPIEKDGFEKDRRHRLEWENDARNPWGRFLVDVDRTKAGGYEFVDRGDWAIFRFPPIHTSWEYVGDSIEIEKRYFVRQDGIASSDGSLVYLGPHDERIRRAGGERLRLAIPHDASLEAPPEEVLSSLEHAARTLDTGSENDDVVAVAAPSAINWKSAGLQSGDDGYWVVDSNPVDDVHNTWVHEYIHTLQEWDHHSSTRWLVEGTTEFYAALLTYQQGRIPFSVFYRHVATGKDHRSVLVDPERWTASNAHYTKGRRVTAALDAQVRTRTDGAASFEDVFRRLNAVEGDLTHDRLREIVTDIGGPDLGNWLDRYVKSQEVPEIPEDEALFSGGSVPDPESGVPESGPDGESGTKTTGTEGIEGECPFCGASVGEDQEFCGACGTALSERCPVCNRQVSDERFCPECGTSLQQECDFCGYRGHQSQEYCPRCGTAFHPE